MPSSGTIKHCNSDQIISSFKYFLAQFKLAIAVAIELSLALLSLLNSSPVGVHPPTHLVKVSKQLYTVVGKLDLEDNLNYF